MEKKKVIVIGVTGRIGDIVCDLISKSNDLEASCGLNATSYKRHPEVSTYNYAEYLLYEQSNVVVDFSRPEATMAVLPYAVSFRLPMVIATTGFNEEQLKAIEDAAYTIPIFMSSNMSRGIYIANRLVEIASTLLTDYNDISIDELHHAGKKDAPSGTAIKIFFDTINKSRGNNLVAAYGETDKKESNEVWMSSRRRGKASGEHTVTFAGESDEISIVHNTYDASIFAKGALDAARYIMQQTEPRIYTMDDLFNE